MSKVQYVHIILFAYVFQSIIYRSIAKDVICIHFEKNWSTHHNVNKIIHIRDIILL